MNHGKPNRPIRSMTATISGVMSAVLVVSASTLLTLGVAAPASAAGCSPEAKATASISGTSSDHTVLSSRARLTDKQGRRATARAKVKVRGTVIGSFTATATVDACPGGIANPVKHTMTVQVTRSAAKAATRAASSSRSPQESTAKKMAVRAATRAASRAALRSAETKMRSQGAAQAKKTVTEAARAMSEAGGTSSNQPTRDQVSAEILRIVNHQRGAASAPAVTSMAPLRAYGDAWASTLIAEQRLYHSNSGNGPTPGMFPQLSNCSSAQRTAEIVTGFHFLDPSMSVERQTLTASVAAVNAFMKSPDHREVLLDSQASRIGVGVAIGTDTLGRPAIAVDIIMFRGNCPQVA